MNKKLVFLIYIVLIVLPFAILIFQIENDVSNDIPTIHVAEFNLPIENDTNALPFVSVDLGEMGLDWEIFIKLKLNRSDGILPTAHLIREHKYELYVEQNLGSKEATAIFSSTALTIWFNVTIINPDRYFVIVESNLGPTTQVTIEYWYEIPELLVRELFTVLFSFMGYFLILGIIPGKIKKWRLMRYRKRQNLERKIREETEYQLYRKKNN